MKNSLKIYLSFIYLTAFLSLFFSWHAYELQQLILTVGFIMITYLFNLDIIKDLQSDLNYLIILPFVIPALVFLDTFYAMLFVLITMLLIHYKSVWYKQFFNASFFTITTFILSFLLHIFINTDKASFIFIPYFFVLLLIISFLYTAFNSIFVFIVVSLEKEKFDIDGLISILAATKTAILTIFLGTINVVLYYYTNLLGIAIFTFVIYFIKPALQYRQIFDNELSTYTNFVLHVLKSMDPITHSHSERVKYWTVLLAKKMELPPAEIRQLSQAASWHDVGKIEVPFYIINKPGKLTKEEYETIKAHPEKGYQLVKDMHFFKKFLPVIRHHHEKYDGTGYPMGLKGEEIPLHARIMAITDAFDAMTADRSYRQGMPMIKAVDELIKYAGTQFDEKIVEVFIKALKEEYGQDFHKFDKSLIENVG